MTYVRKKIDIKLDREYYINPNPHGLSNEPITKEAHFIPILQKVEPIAWRGIFRHYKGMKYPRKGFPVGDTIHRVDVVKRYLRSIISSFSNRDLALPFLAFALFVRHKKKVRIIERIIDQFVNFSDQQLSHDYFKNEWYMAFSTELRLLIQRFLQEYGVNHLKAYYFGRIIATIFENDDAYRYRIEDILLNFSKWDILTRPVASFKRMAEIAIEREEVGGNHKIKQMSRLLQFAMFMPSVRKAFRSAFSQCNFWELQMDEADHYHTLCWSGYKYHGKSLEERQKIYHEIHKDGLPPMIEVPAVT